MKKTLKDSAEDIEQLGRLIRQYRKIDEDHTYELQRLEGALHAQRRKDAEQGEEETPESLELLRSVVHYKRYARKHPPRIKRALVEQIMRSPVRDRRIWLGIVFTPSCDDFYQLILDRIFAELKPQPFHAWKRFWSDLVWVHEQGSTWFHKLKAGPPMKYLGFQNPRGERSWSAPDGLASRVLSGMLRRAKTIQHFLYLIRQGLDHNEPYEVWRDSHWYAYWSAQTAAAKLERRLKRAKKNTKRKTVR